jgi:uncharacterized protein (TIGR03382 family)
MRSRGRGGPNALQFDSNSQVTNQDQIMPAIPEPGLATLLVLGALGVLRARRRG